MTEQPLIAAVKNNPGLATGSTLASMLMVGCFALLRILIFTMWPLCYGNHQTAVQPWREATVGRSAGDLTLNASAPISFFSLARMRMNLTAFAASPIFSLL